uniref:Uncharacterized protein n=1 Tax=Meloidogyne enterolobii TaxID=390850 RepID=A0A6V7X5Z4_MELEN|nr:unnamed protein product [Meloidogyne enterolobii]
MERIFFERGVGQFSAGFSVWVIYSAAHFWCQFLKWDELGSDILSVGRTGE